MNNGRNPMRWNCEKQGCFNVKRRPKIEEFAESLPGKIAFSDIDGITEVNSRFLLLEWKGYAGEIPTGQRIMFERMTTLENFSVLVIVGDPETMQIEQMALFYAGHYSGFEAASLDDVRSRIRRWAAWARGDKLKEPAEAPLADEVAERRNSKEEDFKEILRLEGVYSDYYSDGNDITLTEDEVFEAMKVARGEAS